MIYVYYVCELPHGIQCEMWDVQLPINSLPIFSTFLHHTDAITGWAAASLTAATLTSTLPHLLTQYIQLTSECVSLSNYNTADALYRGIKTAVDRPGSGVFLMINGGSGASGIGVGLDADLKKKLERFETLFSKKKQLFTLSWRSLPQWTVVHSHSLCRFVWINWHL